MWIIRQFIREDEPAFYYGPFQSEEEVDAEQFKLRGCISTFKLYPPEAVGRLEKLHDNLTVY
ncbi:MAG: hypothetical protein ACXABY_28355 [Candidatus Thorarchaeota archaeon]|jgi:hypothetical protein